MTNEISVTSKIEVKNNGVNIKSPGSRVQEDQTGVEVLYQIISATTAGVNLDLSAFTNEGWIWLQNQDSTNFVKFGSYVASTFHPVARMLPDGAPIQMRLEPGVTYRLEADTASCNVLVLAFEE